jgi:hypothetical protein
MVYFFRFPHQNPDSTSILPYIVPVTCPNPLDPFDMLSLVTLVKQHKSQGVMQLPAACSYFLLPRHSLNRYKKSAKTQHPQYTHIPIV